MDKRWCDNCGKWSWATPKATVQWYLLEGMESSLCRPCVRMYKTDYVDIEAMKV